MFASLAGSGQRSWRSSSDPSFYFYVVVPTVCAVMSWGKAMGGWWFSSVLLYVHRDHGDC